MADNDAGKPYNLEDRTFLFAKRCRALVKRLPRTICNIEDAKQLVKASGSVGANYIEANERLSKRDFQLRIKISRKESKESRYWLLLIDTNDDPEVNQERQALVQEATELLKILSSMLRHKE